MTAGSRRRLAGEIELENGAAHLSPPSPPSSILSAGYQEIDAALGGGFPSGTLVEVLGSESSLKTHLALACLKAAPEHFTPVYVDADHTLALTCEQRASLGRIVLALPDAWSDIDTLFSAMESVRLRCLVVVDSLAAMPVGLGWGKAEQSVVGTHVERWVGAAVRLGWSVVLVDQLRCGDHGQEREATLWAAKRAIPAARLVCTTESASPERGDLFDVHVTRTFGPACGTRRVQCRFSPVF